MLPEQLQLIKELIQSDSYFADVKIIGADPKTIGTDINHQIGQLKLSAEVQMVGAGASSDASNTAQFDNIFPAVWFYDNRKLNKTGITSLHLAERFCELVKAAGGFLAPNITLDLMEGNCLTYQPSDDANIAIHGVILHTGGEVAQSLPQVETPVITETNGNITMTCETGRRATIFYTLDGSDPVPGNPEAFVYESLFAPPAGLEIRAQAWANGWMASDEAELESTAGGGDGIDPDMNVTFEKIRNALIAKGGDVQLTTAGGLVIKGPDGKWTPVEVTVGPAPSYDRNLVASQDATDDIP